jgi:phage head maturation protease
MIYGVDLEPVRTSDRTVLRLGPEGVFRGAALSMVETRSDRWISGTLLNFGPILTADLDGDPMYLDIQPESIRSWFARVNPRDMPVVVDHATGPAGRFVALFMYADRINAICEAALTPAGDLLKEGCDDGTCPGFSFQVRNVRPARKTGTRNGLEVWTSVEVELVEGGPSTDPSDPDARIEAVGGERTAYLSALDTFDRAATLRSLRRV